MKMYLNVLLLYFSAILTVQPTLAEDKKKDAGAGEARTTVKAPFTKVETDGSNTKTSVKAPFTKVETSQTGSKTVKAPFTRVETDATGTKTTVKAPLVEVETDNAGHKRIRVPFVKIDLEGDKLHIRAPFVDKWTDADTKDQKKVHKNKAKDSND